MWDRGFCRIPCPPEITQEEALWRGLDCGLLDFEFDGEKLKGQWQLLVSVSTTEWAIQKLDDKYASKADILLQNRSVLSGMTLEELYDEEEHTEPRTYKYHADLFASS
jgi:bifunctional non-homologous end joining protein LigD